MSRCSLDIDGDQEVAVTGASGREAHKIDYYEQRDSLCSLSLLISTKHHSSLADDGLAMVTGHVMKLDAVSVKVVEDSQADLVALSVVWLGPTRSEICTN